MPLVDRRIELHAGIAANVRAFGDLPQQGPRILAVTWLTIPNPASPPFASLQGSLHELITHAYAKVFILVHDRPVGVAVITAVIALLDQSPRLLLFALLGVDEFFDVRMPIF